LRKKRQRWKKNKDPEKRTARPIVCSDSEELLEQVADKIDSVQRLLADRHQHEWGRRVADTQWARRVQILHVDQWARRVADTSTSYFTYVPSSILAEVGQHVQLWPLNASLAVFAVAPDLPPGITIDMHTGVIQGTAETASDGPGRYFVTSCDFCDIGNVKMCFVDIDIVDVGSELLLQSSRGSSTASGFSGYPH